MTANGAPCFHALQMLLLLRSCDGTAECCNKNPPGHLLQRQNLKPEATKALSPVT
eukprot:CAMPEP_0172892188 /NCGR_PEP_ID=MMETSP1075-20121228/145654_1 /TAXON_ID=2916 /ORGANISM="Ceratium fusus, Strain PA161109" /LENGTH=54 /DNA_ID=CAMNT_0013746783 /DNA_START=164 /DNA_END=324 /DNA_ORIENTATION=-